MKVFLLIILTTTIFLLPESSYAQQPQKITSTFFPEPHQAVKFPRGKELTTYAEMIQFINNASQKYPGKLSLYSIGTSTSGIRIPAIRLGGSNTGEKVRVLFLGRIHGDEAAGTEALLQLIDKYINQSDRYSLPDSLELTIIPMIDIDGIYCPEKVRKRDCRPIPYPFTESQEIFAVRKFCKMYQPDVVIHFREYAPVLPIYDEITTENISIPFDLLYLKSDHANVSESIQYFISSRLLPGVRENLKRHKITHHTGFSSTLDYGNIVFRVGDNLPQSLVTSFALGNTISLTFASRGIGLGMSSIKRRVNSLSVVAENLLEQINTNATEIREIIKEAVRDSSDLTIQVKEKERTDYRLPFINVNTNQPTVMTADASILYSYTPLLKRPRPQIYLIARGYPEIIRQLQLLGVEVQQLGEAETFEAEKYLVTEYKTEKNIHPDGFYPVSVKTEIDRQQIRFPAGTYVVQTQQRNGPLAATLLEPESTGGFVNYRIYQTNENQELPVYRIMSLKENNYFEKE